MEEELEKTEEDREVENLLRSNREKHNKLQKGTVHSCRDCRNVLLMCTVQYIESMS